MAFQGYKHKRGNLDERHELPSSALSRPAGPESDSEIIQDFPDTPSADHEFGPVYDSGPVPGAAARQPGELPPHEGALPPLEKPLERLIDFVSERLLFPPDDVASAKMAAREHPVESRLFFEDLYEREVKPSISPPSLQRAMKDETSWSFQYDGREVSAVLSVPRRHAAFHVYHGKTLVWVSAENTPFADQHAGSGETTDPKETAE